MTSATPASAPEYPAPSVAWRAVGIFTVLYMFSYVDRKLLSLMVGPIQRDLHITDFQFGLLQGFAFSLLYVTAGIPLGRMVDRYPRRIIVYAGVTFWSVATALTGWAQSFVGLLLARFGVGVGEASLSPAAYSMISDLFPRERIATALGVYGIGITVGSGVAYAVGGWIVSVISEASEMSLGWLGSFHAWQLAFLLAGAPGLVLAFAVFLIPEPQRMGRAAPLMRARPVALIRVYFASRKGLLLCHFLGFALLTTWSFAVSSWTPAFFGREFGWDIWKTGMALAVYTGVFGTIGSLSGGRIVDRCVRRGMRDAHLRIPLWSAAIAIPMGAAAFWVSSPWLAISLLCLMQGFLMVFTGPAVGALQLVTPNELRGQVSAVYLFVVSLLGFGIGPIFVGALTDFWFADPHKIGSSIAIVILFCGPLAVLLLSLGLAPFRRAHDDP